MPVKVINLKKQEPLILIRKLSGYNIQLCLYLSNIINRSETLVSTEHEKKYRNCMGRLLVRKCSFGKEHARYLFFYG